MLDRFKNLKIVQKLKENVSPRLRWLSFANKNNLDKSSSEYLQSLSGVELKSMNEAHELEMMVRNQLKEDLYQYEANGNMILEEKKQSKDKNENQLKENDFSFDINTGEYVPCFVL